jgi:hypothetical protein
MPTQKVNQKKRSLLKMSLQNGLRYVAMLMLAYQVLLTRL